MKDLKDLDLFAFTSTGLQSQYINKAQSTIIDAFKKLNHHPKNVLTINESWASIALRDQGLDVSTVSEIKADSKFDTILMLDESVCKYPSENTQKQDILKMLSYLDTNGKAFFSFRDFRNGNYHRRPLGDTVINTIDGEDFVTLEINEQIGHDKQAWNQKMYLIKNHNEFSTIDCGQRRTLYFKQLAKYSFDAGFTDFGVFKELFWKGTWRRTPEHIAWISKK